MQHTFKTQLQKIGSWTIAVIPMDVKKVFGTRGTVRVKGTIDHFQFKGISLMPRGDGTHFLTIRAEIRKAIKKEAPAKIVIVLERDTDALEVPEELTEAFEASPEAQKMFETLSYSHKGNFTKPITTSKNKETRVKRAVDAVIKLERMYFEKPPKLPIAMATANDHAITIPADLKKLLSANKLLSYFEKMPPSHQKEYVQWIESAKKEETRQKRLEGTISKLKAK